MPTREQIAEALAEEPKVFPKYKLTEAHFMGPWLLKAGTVIEFDGEPAPHFEPVNQQAKDMIAAYYKAHPEASLNTFDGLVITPGAEAKPTFAVVGEEPAEEVISFVDMAQRAGYTNEPARVQSLAEAKSTQRDGG